MNETVFARAREALKSRFRLIAGPNVAMPGDDIWNSYVQAVWPIVTEERDHLKAALKSVHEGMLELEDGGFAPTARRAWGDMAYTIAAALPPTPAAPASAQPAGSSDAPPPAESTSART